jgi:hypothetical protein
MALRSLKSATLLRAGLPSLLAGLTLLVAGMWIGDLSVFVIGTVFTGVGTGLIFRGAMSTVSESARSGSHAEALAGFFVSVYVGLSVPVVALGIASGHVSARVLMLIFVLAVALATTASVRSVVRGSVTNTAVQQFDTPEIGTTVSSPIASTNFVGESQRARGLDGTASIATLQEKVVVHSRQRTHRLRQLASNSSSNQSSKCTKEKRDDQ